MDIVNPKYPDTEGRRKLRSWLNKTMRIEMTDGRILIGLFVCSDSQQNVILADCHEYLDHQEKDEPRSLGLAMIPGHHIVSVKRPID